MANACHESELRTIEPKTVTAGLALSGRAEIGESIRAARRYAGVARRHLCPEIKRASAHLRARRVSNHFVEATDVLFPVTVSF
jgi:hypothetical protein